MGKRKGFTLVEILVVIVIIGILAALLIPAIARAIRRSHVTCCANNLSQLWKLQNVYMATYGGRMKHWATDTGKNFWLMLNKPEINLVDSTMTDIYTCPAMGPLAGPGDTHYFGPCVEVNDLGDGNPVGCDDPDAAGIAGKRGHPHSDAVNVIRKSSDVVEMDLQTEFAGLDKKPIP